MFARSGFEATTTRDIAEAAEIAAGTVFNLTEDERMAVIEYLKTL